MKAGVHPALRNLGAVLFDVGGTLVHPDWARLGELVEAETGALFTPNQMTEAFYAMLQVVDSELIAQAHSKRTLEPHWTFLETFRSLGMDEMACETMRTSLNVAHYERHLWCKPDPEASTVLVRLKRAGLRIAAISNTEDGRVNESLVLSSLASELEFLIDSHKVGYRKPDAAIFQLGLDRLGLEPGEVAYVGDSFGHDVIGAQQAGLCPILLDRSAAYKEAAFTRISSLGELVS